MGQYFNGDSTRKILADTIERGAPYYPFENINLSGSYKYKDDNKVLRLHEYQRGVFGVGDNPGGKLLLDVAEGWQVQVIVTVEKDNFFDPIGGYSTGFPAYKSRAQITLDGDANGKLYADTGKDGRIYIDCNEGTFDRDIPTALAADNYFDFKIVSVTLKDLPSGLNDDELKDATGDDGDTLIEDDLDGDNVPGPTDPTIVPPIDPPIDPPEEPDMVRVVIMALVLGAIGVIIWRLIDMGGGETIGE